MIRTRLQTLLRLEAVAWAAMLLLFAGFAAESLQGLAPHLLSGQLAGSDFLAQWSFARMAWEGQGAHIYDREALHAFQLQLAPTLHQTFPYPYPPTFLLAIAPLGALGFPAAMAVWMAGTFALYLAAAWPSDRGWLSRSLVLLAPAVACNLAYGQNGFLTAALVLGGFRLLPRWPAVAGLAFGLLSFKPQFGILIPVALVASGQWRAIAASAATIAALILLSASAFGWRVWSEWLAYLPIHADYVDATVNSYHKPTLQGALLLAGADPRLARFVPLLVLAVAAPLAGWCFRVRSPLAVAALVAGTIAGAPYAFIYDLPVITGATIAALAARRADGTRLVDDAIIAMALLVPAIMTLTSRFYWIGGTAMLALFALIILRAAPWRERARDAVARA